MRRASLPYIAMLGLASSAACMSQGVSAGVEFVGSEGAAVEMQGTQDANSATRGLTFVTNLTSDAYLLGSFVPGFVADVADPNANEGAPLVHNLTDGSNLERWAFVPGASGTHGWQVHNVMSGKCLDVSPQASGDGAALVLSTCRSVRTQFWQVVPDSNQAVTFRNVDSGMCMAVSNDSPNTHTPLVQNTCGPAVGQRWQVLPKTFVSRTAYGAVHYAVSPNNSITATSFDMQVPTAPPATGTLFVVGQLFPVDATDANDRPIKTGWLGPALTWGPACITATHPADYSSWWVSGDYFNSNGNQPNHTGCLSGSAMAVNANDTLKVTLSLQGTTWTQTVLDATTAQSVTYTLDMQGQAQTGLVIGFNAQGQQPVADVIFRNLKITVAQPDNGFCTPDWQGGNDAAAIGVVSPDMRSCTVSEVVTRAAGVAATTPNP